MEDQEEKPSTSSTINELVLHPGSQTDGEIEQDQKIEELRSSSQEELRSSSQEELRSSSQEELRSSSQEELHEDLTLQFQILSLSNNEDKQDDTVSVYSTEPTPVEVNSNIMYEILHNEENYTSLNGSNNVYDLIPLSGGSMEYLRIKSLFTSTNKNSFNVKSIQKIYNPYLLAQFKLMEMCYRKRYGHTIIKRLLHGTSAGNIDNICKYNFDWRLKGTSRGTRYGQGVYFTPIANYATFFGDKTFEKVMIVADVLVSNKFVGAAGTVIPPLNCDTTIKDNEHVFVKYEDNAFYPAYVIHYQGINYRKQTRRRFFI